jgi:hypothetical protein
MQAACSGFIGFESGTSAKVSCVGSQKIQFKQDDSNIGANKIDEVFLLVLRVSAW